LFKIPLCSTRQKRRQRSKQSYVYEVQQDIVLSVFHFVQRRTQTTRVSIAVGLATNNKQQHRKMNDISSLRQIERLSRRRASSNKVASFTRQTVADYTKERT